MLIEAEGTRLLRDQRIWGDPAGAQRRGGSTIAPRKASACSVNQPAGMIRALAISILNLMLTGN
ncbi:hypothetical protein [Heyndrickxia acidicola]|uniref:Uncharacterized protein n=1 Tax=Heyndrickxia acidicola TaxID=209389 RepID=A0ABU6MGF9_9BACI|nr:hypothetical protein [Heyndrickxia acidicola]MED1203764.1 hypothetical protein [Heyndrickxia acidicola]